MSRLKSLDGLFAGRHFDRDVIILCVRWYWLNADTLLRLLHPSLVRRSLLRGALHMSRWRGVRPQTRSEIDRLKAPFK